MNENIKVMNAAHAGDNMDYQNTTTTDYYNLTVETREPYGMDGSDWLMLVTMLVLIATTIFWFGKTMVRKLRPAYLWIKHCFVLKKIPQRKFEKKIKELEDQVSSHETMIGNLMGRLMEKETEASNLSDDLQHAMSMIASLQAAINQAHQERNNLRLQIMQMEVNRYDVVVTKSGSCWHLRRDCQFLQNAQGTKVLTACCGCTAPQGQS